MDNPANDPEMQKLIAMEVADIMKGMTTRTNWPDPNSPGVKEIEISRGMKVLVDEDDYEEISKYKWRAQPSHGTAYAIRNIYIRGVGKRTISMHRVINKTPDGFLTDHINGNGLDNRKSNLRTCTHKENQRNIGLNSSNTTGFKGVTLCKSSGKFRARIKIDGKKINLGSYATAEEASAVYSKKAKQIYGEFYHEG